MASKETKFTEDELKQLQDLQTSYQQAQLQFGQLKVQQVLAQQQADAMMEAEDKLEADYVDIQESERKLVDTLNEKYGPGSLDPTTGVFTPTPQTEEPTS
jgi:hypothetical protein